MDLHGASALCGLKPILRRIEGGPGLADLFELQDGLNLLRTFCRFNKDEAQDFAAGQGDFWVIGNLGERRYDVLIARFDLGLLGRRHLARDCGGLAQRRQEHPQPNKGGIGKLSLVDMRAVLGDG